MNTITMVLNEPAVKAWTYGWVSCTPHEELNKKNPGEKWFKVVLTKEQYESYPGSEFDPWVD